jgi:uncharacterized protein YlxP (DUF503 family)
MTAGVHVHPAVLSTNEQLRAEVERLKTLAALNADQAKLNADTIGEQQRHYDEVLTRLHRKYQQKLAEKNDQIDAIKSGVAVIIKQRNAAEKKFRDLEELLENALIPDPKRPGESASLFYLVESREFRVRCSDCRTWECTVDGGCGAPCPQ